MPVPKQKTSRKRRGDRRKHIKISAMSLTACSHCEAPILPHRLCPECGYYKGREVIKDKRLMTNDKKQKQKVISHKS